MTATVSPPHAAVARADPAVRLADYAASLKFYLSFPADCIDRIVFADNSASDLSSLFSLVQRENLDKRVELLSFPANDHPVEFGKAYGEFRLIDTALDLTQLINPDDRVWKTTGRLQCLNLVDIDSRARGEFAFICDLFNVPFVRTGSWRRRGSMDLRLFAFEPAAYSRWIAGCWRAEDARIDEGFMYRKMLEACTATRVLTRFPIQPRIAGLSGRTGRDYQHRSQRMKEAIRGWARRAAPWIWI